MKILKNKLQLILLVFITAAMIACNDESINDQSINDEVIDNSEIPKSALKSYFDKIDDNNFNFSKTGRDLSFIDADDPCNYECLEDCSGSRAISYNMQDEAELIFALSEKMSDFRDKYLLSGETGNYYTNAYYEMSNVFMNEKLPTISDIIKNVQVIPTLFKIENRINDPNYKGIVINESEKLELIDFINLYEKKINNSNLGNVQVTRYSKIINAVKTDLKNLTNRTNSQIISFFKN